MAKLHFKYASMNSGKSIDLLRTVYNYEENGFKVLVLKPQIDTKAGENIQTRIGLERKVDFLINEKDSILNLLKSNLQDITAIFIDEVQFLNKNQIEELFLISKAIDIPIICYGLRNNFKMEAFEGSRRLLEIADILEELSTLCNCGNIARYVARKHNNSYEEDGEEIIIDGEENYEYEPLCGNCYLTKVKKINFKKIRNNLR